MLLKKRPSWISPGLWIGLMRQHDRNKVWRRQAIRFCKNHKLAIAYSRYRRAIAAADWPGVKQHALAVTALAVKARDRQTTAEMVNTLERVGCYRESSCLWMTEVAPQGKILPNEWRGEDLADKTLLINFNFEDTHGLGVAYRCAHLVPRLIESARRTMILLEPRLAPTFKRTFPALEIFTAADDVPEDEIDFVALPAYLKARFDTGGSVPEHIRRLQPDPEKTTQLRNKYLAAGNSGAPLIGISWHSSHHGKDLPAIKEWRDFIGRTDATFVSLQYGNIVNDLNVMGRERIIADPSIDQMVNMDDFAAQVAALDGVITIMNTLVNVGASLGVPTIVLRDDWFRRNTPHLGDRMPWFHRLRFAGKNRRDWPPVFDEALQKLREMWAEQETVARRPAGHN